MTVRVFTLGAAATAVLAWAVWLVVLSWLDPVQAGWIGFLLFFLSLFLAVAGSAGLIGYGVRRIINPGQHPTYSVRPALRQGILLGLFLDLLLALQLLRLLRWWIAFILIVLLLSTELVFLSYDQRRRIGAAGTRGEENARAGS